MGDCLPVAAQCGIWAAHPGMGVTVACARCGHIDGKDQRGTTRRFSAFQGVTHKAAIAQNIQLKPHRTLDSRGDFFNRAYGYCGKRKRNAFGISGGGGLNFAPTRIHAAQTDRCKGHRHGERFVEQLCLQAQVGHILQHALAKGHLRQVCHVTAQSVLCIRPTVNIVEQEGG